MFGIPLSPKPGGTRDTIEIVSLIPNRVSITSLYVQFIYLIIKKFKLKHCRLHTSNIISRNFRPNLSGHNLHTFVTRGNKR